VFNVSVGCIKSVFIPHTEDTLHSFSKTTVPSSITLLIRPVPPQPLQSTITHNSFPTASPVHQLPSPQHVLSMPSGSSIETKKKPQAQSQLSNEAQPFSQVQSTPAAIPPPSQTPMIYSVPSPPSIALPMIPTSYLNPVTSMIAEAPDHAISSHSVLKEPLGEGIKSDTVFDASSSPSPSSGSNEGAISKGIKTIDSPKATTVAVDMPLPLQTSEKPSIAKSNGKTGKRGNNSSPQGYIIAPISEYSCHWLNCSFSVDNWDNYTAHVSTHLVQQLSKSGLGPDLLPPSTAASKPKLAPISTSRTQAATPPSSNLLDPIKQLDAYKRTIALQSRYLSSYQQWGIQLLSENERLKKSIDVMKVQLSKLGTHKALMKRNGNSLLNPEPDDAYGSEISESPEFVINSPTTNLSVQSNETMYENQMT
jgi:hypothetical protein